MTKPEPKTDDFGDLIKELFKVDALVFVGKVLAFCAALTFAIMATITCIGAACDRDRAVAEFEALQQCDLSHVVTVEVMDCVGDKYHQVCITKKRLTC